jgi:hypothetical protein
MNHTHDQSVRGETEEAQVPADRPFFASPRMFFLVAAFLSFLLSVGLFFTGDRERGIFVGIWVPSILSAGSLILAGRNR